MSRPVSRLPVVLLIALVVTATFAALAVPPAEAQGTGVREVRHIDSASAHPERRFEAFDTANLNLHDVDGDGKPEIITQNDNNRVYVIDPRRGIVLAELSTWYPSNDGGASWGARVLSGVAVGDLDRDGRTDLVVTNSAAQLTRFSFVPDQSTADRFVFEEKWHVHVDAREFDPETCDEQAWIPNCTTAHPGLDGNPAVGDVEGDGTQEIFVNTDDFPGHFSFTADGQLRWMTAWWDGNAGPTVTDIDGDGTLEAVFVTDGGIVAVYNAKTGKVRWSFDARKQGGAFPGSMSVSAQVADVRGDGTKVIVVGARNVSRNYCCDPQWVQKSHARYYAFDPIGRMLWNVSFEWGNPHLYMHPAAVDVNGDGYLDFLFMDWNTVGHKPGNWETTGRPTNLFALNGRNGTLLWRAESNVWWSNKDLVVADVTGDGEAEVVAADARGGEGLSLYKLATGERFAFIPVNGWGLSRGPVAADLYGDGRTFLIVPVMKPASGCTRSIDVGCREGALKIFEASGAIEDALWTNNVRFNAALDADVAGTAGPDSEPLIDDPKDHEPVVTPGNDTGSDTDETPGDTGRGGGGDGAPPRLTIPVAGLALWMLGLAIVAVALRGGRG